MEIPQKELDFIASFERFNLSPSKADQASGTEISEPYHKSFPLFCNLLPEIRNQIWDLTLPGPRIILINQVAAPKDPNSDPYTPQNAPYIASPISYAGKHPIALSICRESRGQALRHLTERFHAYWNLKQDMPYFEIGSRRSFVRDEWMRTPQRLLEMSDNGLLDGFKSVALDLGVWAAENYEHCLSLEFLSTCPQVMPLYTDFICRYRLEHMDVLDPSESWYLVDADTQEQIEFRRHKDWGRCILQYQNVEQGELLNQ